MGVDHQANLLAIYQAAIDACHGRRCVKTFLRQYDANHSGFGPVYLIAIGKAAAEMALGAQDVLAERLLKGLVITRHNACCDALDQSIRISQMTAGHPIPDEQSLDAGRALLAFIEDTPMDAQLIFLISGGASALVEVLPDTLGLDDLRMINDCLIGSGLAIDAINRIRKGLSMIKGGRLTSYLEGRRVLNLLISDVMDDDPAIIGSGLLVPSSGLDQAINVQVDHLLSRCPVSDALKTFMETMPCPPGASLPQFESIETHIIATAQLALQAAAAWAHGLGYSVVSHEAMLHGRVDDAAKQIMRCVWQGEPGLYLWGGETTIELPFDHGRGGRCQHLALLLAREMQGKDQLCGLFAGTDGSDGPGDVAGAMIDGGTIARGAEHGCSVEHCLQHADSRSFFELSGGLIALGPTGTNVMDIMMVLRTR